MMGCAGPRQYQDFVFVRGAFAGMLSPEATDSRTDGALSQVFLQGNDRLTAEYVRYSDKDAACCPASTTSVVFDVARDGPVLRAISATTSPNR
jgi:LppP/LprE lipoprotein